MYQMPWRIVRARAIVRHVTQTMRGTDKELQTTVTEELLYTPNIDATGVQVQAKDGTVTLSGEVASLPERLAAERAAMRVRVSRRSRTSWPYTPPRPPARATTTSPEPPATS